MTPRLTRIDIYPIKSLDGLPVQTAQVLPSGALQHDRGLALFDVSGRVVNGKRTPKIHQVRSRFGEDVSQVTLWIQDSDQRQTFHLDRDRAGLEDWFSHYFQQTVMLGQNTNMGFPDDTDSPGPTVISTATLQAVADWYELSLENTRQRFRSNLEIDGVPAFWEDRLFSASGAPVPFQIGSVTFQGINPCQRCVVPTRDPDTGDAIAGFQKRFIEQRLATLPEGVARSRFNHFFRLAVNTQASRPKQGQLTVGDVLRV
jgi:uncharacterized protein YcbX